VTASPAVPRRTLQIALLVAAAFFMENLDGSVIVTALPQMARSFGTDPVDLNIGVTAYMLALTVFIPISGWMADRFGARNVFAGAVAGFTGASILCGLCSGLWSFTACRILQGLGGAMMMPVGRLVVLRATENRDRIRVISYIVWPGLVAPVVGPPLGGFITTYLSWRWIFFLNLPLGLLGIVLALKWIGGERGAVARRFDLRGFLLCGAACVLVTYGLELLGRTPTPWLQLAICLGAGSGLGALTVRHLRRARDPLLDFGALRVPTYTMVMRGGSLFRIAASGAPFLLPLMFQLGFGLDALTSGLLVLAVFAGSLGMKAISTRMLRRYGFRRVLLWSGLLTALTLLGCATFTRGTPYAVVAATLFLSGLTRSLQFSALNSLAFADISGEQMSPANTLSNMAQQMTLGLGVTVAVLALRLSELLHGGTEATPSVTDFRSAFVVLAMIAAISALDALTLRRDAGALVSGHSVPPPR